MNLEDLLSTLRTDILNDRSDRVSGSADYLWTDETLVRYINDAQRRFAVKGLVIRDGTTAEVTQITLVEGQSQYDLHESVISVVSAKVSTANMDLQRVGHAPLASYRPPNTLFWDPSNYTVLTPGVPLAYSTDEQVIGDDNDSFGLVSLRIYPEPNAAAAGTIIKLRVIRKPIEELRANNPSAHPEIPVDHHLEMLDWAAYMALRIVDADAGNPKRADEFRASFEDHVRNARNLILRKLFAPMPWGFGRGGWSWES